MLIMIIIKIIIPYFIQIRHTEEEERLFGKINVHYAYLYMIGYASETPIKTHVTSTGATKSIMINTTYIINIYIHIQNM